jgi:hypothetical protein
MWYITQLISLAYTATISHILIYQIVSYCIVQLTRILLQISYLHWSMPDSLNLFIAGDKGLSLSF